MPYDAATAVPEAPALKREVWTNDDYRRLARVAKMLKARNVAFTLICRTPGCGPLKMGRDETSGAVTLTCGCTRREYSVR